MMILPHIPIPARMLSVLRPHQVTGLDFLWTALHPTTNTTTKTTATNGDDNEDEDADYHGNSITAASAGAILADEMGLGKTLMTVALITALHRRERDKVCI